MLVGKGSLQKQTARSGHLATCTESSAHCVESSNELLNLYAALRAATPVALEFLNHVQVLMRPPICFGKVDDPSIPERINLLKSVFRRHV
jgi:hypothetical protein